MLEGILIAVIAVALYFAVAYTCLLYTSFRSFFASILPLFRIGW